VIGSVGSMSKSIVCRNRVNITEPISPAKADFTDSPAECIGHHSVDSNRGEKKSDRNKDSQEFQSEPARRWIFGDYIVHGSDAEHRDGRIDRLHLAANRLAQDARISGGTQVHHRPIWWNLRFGNVDAWHAGQIETIRLNVADNPDNSHVRYVISQFPQSKFDMLPDCVSIALIQTLRSPPR